jgi:hypothetical protein
VIEDLAILSVAIVGGTAVFAALRWTYNDQMAGGRRSDPGPDGPARYRVCSILVALPGDRRAALDAGQGGAVATLLAAIDAGAPSACDELPARSRSDARRIAAKCARKPLRPPARRSAGYRDSASSIVPGREGFVVARCVLAAAIAAPGAAEALRAVADGRVLAPIPRIRRARSIAPRCSRRSPSAAEAPAPIC